MNVKYLGLSLLALAACQAAPPSDPIEPGEAFASVRFEFDS